MFLYSIANIIHALHGAVLVASSPFLGLSVVVEFYYLKRATNGNRGILKAHGNRAGRRVHGPVKRTKLGRALSLDKRKEDRITHRSHTLAHTHGRSYIRETVSVCIRWWV